MRLISVFFWLIAAANAQPKLAINLPSPAQAVAGTSITVPIMLSGSTGNIVSLQDTVTITGATVANLSISTPLANKASVCTPGFAVCILVGEVPSPTIDSAGNVTAVPGTIYNATSIVDGTVVQNLTFTIPATTALNSTITVTIAGTLASDAGSNLVALAGSSTAITVTTFMALANQAFTIWRANPTQSNYVALTKAIAAAQ